MEEEENITEIQEQILVLLYFHHTLVGFLVRLSIFASGPWDIKNDGKFNYS